MAQVLEQWHRPIQLLVWQSLVFRVSSQHVFTDTNSLQNAVNLWVSNEATARTQYGEIGTWNVERVTNMDLLFNDKESFNADLSDWDTSQVTSMVSALLYCACAQMH